MFLHQVLSTYQIFPYKIKWWNSNILEYYVLAKDNVNFIHTRINSTGKYMFKANSRKTKTRWEICSKLTIKTLERRYWHLYCGLWTYFTPCPSVFIVNFEQVNTGWLEIGVNLPPESWSCECKLIIQPNDSWLHKHCLFNRMLHLR